MVSYYTVSNFFTDTDSDPVSIQAIFLNIHNKIFIGTESSIFIYKLKLVIFFQRIWKLHAGNQPFSSIREKGHISVTYADNLCLPFALLAAKTFLPPGVLILALNPWTLDLDLFLGWNVIFIVLHLLFYNLIWKGILIFILLENSILIVLNKLRNVKQIQGFFILKIFF